MREQKQNLQLKYQAECTINSYLPFFLLYVWRLIISSNNCVHKPKLLKKSIQKKNKPTNSF